MGTYRVQSKREMNSAKEGALSIFCYHFRDNQVHEVGLPCQALAIKLFIVSI